LRAQKIAEIPVDKLLQLKPLCGAAEFRRWSEQQGADLMSLA
jgi:hypothetical protein